MKPATSQREATVITQRRNFKTFTYKTSPAFLQDNDFILTGYRPESTFWACIESMFSLHNETWNIWTHLFGAVLFFGLMIYSTFFSFLKDYGFGERGVFVVFTVVCQCCMLASAALHTFGCISAKAHFKLCQCDYCCICLLICGSFFPPLYYTFYCDTTARDVYLIILMVLSLPVFVAPMFERFHRPEFRPWRSASFWALGLFGVFPTGHILLFLNPAEDLSAILLRGIAPALLMALFYGIGTSFYVFRVPERFSPGKFDIFFHSHQIFHVFVVIAAITHYIGTMNYAYWRLSQQCPAAAAAAVAVAVAAA